MAICKECVEVLTDRNEMRMRRKKVEREREKLELKKSIRNKQLE
jgi:hypothetical protein